MKEQILGFTSHLHFYLNKVERRRAIFICGCQDDRGNNKSNMTLTSLTGKSLKATRGARWRCLCHSRWVTDKHHAGSINRLIAISPLPQREHSVRTVTGCCFVKMIIINRQSQRSGKCTLRRRARRTWARKRSAPNVSRSPLVTDA